MKPVNKDVLREICHKLMFQINEDEYDKLLHDFDFILGQMKLIGEIENVDDASPMTFPFDASIDYLREDVVEETLSREDALKNCSSIENGEVILPKVVK